VSSSHDLLGFGEPYQNVVCRLTDIGKNQRQLRVCRIWSRSAQHSVDISDPKSKVHKNLHQLCRAASRGVAGGCRSAGSLVEQVNLLGAPTAYDY
jgi:hypothetical protein